MAFTRPTLPEIIDRIEGDFVSRLTGGGALLRRALVKVFARVLAGGVHHLYGYIAWMLKQVIIDTADPEYLKRWANIFGITQKAAEFSTGKGVFTGTNGTIIPAGTELQSADGLLFTTDSLGTILSGTASVSVTAREAGEGSNLDASTELTLTSPISGIGGTVTVDSNGITGGLDQESTEDLLERLLERIRNAPNGGAENDYIAWAKEVSGVTRAWVLPGQYGPSTLALVVVCDELTPIIPDSTKITEVQNYIDDESRRPVTANVTVIAPTTVPLNPTISISPDTPAIRAAVQAEIIDLLAREGDLGGTLHLSQINEAISIASGESYHTLSSPSADISYGALQIGTMGTITWV